MSRDPRTDPQAGDILRSTISKHTRERRVIARIGHIVEYALYRGDGPGSRHLCRVSTWTGWCRIYEAKIKAIGETTT
jgi:hypothetical protein